MPPRASSKRKAAPPSTSAASVTSCEVVSTRAASGKGKARKEVDKIESLFESYANQSMNMIDPEGVETLCSDLKVDHADVRILMLAWKMQAEKQGYFSKDEWQRGLKELKADTIAKLKKSLPGLEKELMYAPKFEDFYSYAFQYCLTEERQKSLDIETVCELLNLVLGPRYRLQVDLLIKYLKVQTEYRAVNMDQWVHFYRFCNEGLVCGPGFKIIQLDDYLFWIDNPNHYFGEISFPDLQNYDTDQAWPVILDNFVEWMREKQN